MGIGLKGFSKPEIELMESESKIPGLWTLEKAVGIHLQVGPKKFFVASSVWYGLLRY